jgi:DNA-binding NtrC family response regulator
MNPRILVIDDEARFRDLYAATLRDAGFDVHTADSAAAARELLQHDTPAMVVSDVRMPGMDGIAFLREVRATHPDLPFLLVTAFADVRDAVTALKLGAVDYLAKPVDLDELAAAVSDAVGGGPGEQETELPAGALAGIVAESSAMRALFRDAWRVASSEATVLLTGESGTGKEVVASFIHRHSARAKGPFVAVNCAAIPETLLASELFGHEKGAFTGAVARRLGRFREASGGTLFLDEIGDMPLGLQPALLRAIETGAVTPVGGAGEVACDLRLIAATNRDLGKDVEASRFRQDLYFRLNVIALHIPPLRERPEEILPLARFFLGHSSGGPKRLSPAAARLLQACAWPGNVRELANAVERGRVLSPADVILPEHLPPAVAQRATPPPSTVGTAPAGGAVVSLDQIERDSIERALQQTGGNRTKAAELLGLSRRALIYKLKRYRTGG